MEYIQAMVGFLVKRLRRNMLELVGILTIVGITVPTIWINFNYQLPNRWWASGLILAYAALFILDERFCGIAPRASYVYMAAQTVIVLAILLLQEQAVGWLIILYFVLSVQAMTMFPFRVAMVWIGLFILATAVVLLLQAGLVETLVIMPIYLGGFFFFGAFSYQTAEADRARQRSEEFYQDLQTAHQKLQAYASQIETLAVAEERNRLSREMHDTLGHRLTVAAVQLEGAQRLIDQEPERAAEMVDTVRSQVREALSELRATVATLRTPLEADLSLHKALLRLAQGFEEATGITIHLMFPENIPDLPETHRLALYRSAQEALTNIQRHARAEAAWLQLSCQDGGITLLVRDNGIGIDASQAEAGFGLRGLQERAARLGGEFLVEPRSGGGTQVSIRLPLVLSGDFATSEEWQG